MAWLNGKHLIWLASAVLLTCTLLHTQAWSKNQSMFAPSTSRVVALLWFLLAIDWAVLAALWVLGANFGAPARPLLLISAVVPSAVAIGLVITFGPGFYPIYLQLAAVVLLLVGTLRLA